MLLLLLCAGAANLTKLRDKSKELLAPHPYGVLRDAFLNQLLREANLRLDRESNVSRGLMLCMPDVAYIPEKFNVGGVSDRIYPAYYPKLLRRMRTAVDYDPSTETGAAAFQQFRDATMTLLERHPKGWKRKTFRIELRKFGHYVSFELMQQLIERMPEVAVWDSPGPYEEYDAVRPYKPPALKPKEAAALAKEAATAKREAKARGEKPKGLSLAAAARAKRQQQLDRFLRWYDDPYPKAPRRRARRASTRSAPRAAEGVEATSSESGAVEQSSK